MNIILGKKEILKMSILPLLKAAPELCGVIDPERWAWIAEAVYVEELKNHDSVFARKGTDVDNPGRRLKPVLAWMTGEKGGVEEYILNLCIFADNSHRIKEHGDRHLLGTTAALEKWLRDREAQYSNVSLLLSVDQAALGVWF